MPIQVLPALQKQKGYGEILGTGLGEGLSALLKHKVGEIEARKKADAWHSIGFSNEESKFIMAQPESIQKELLDRVERHGSVENGEEGSGLRLFGNKPKSQSSESLAREIADEKAVEPFLIGQNQDFNNSKFLYSKAKSMLNNLRKNKKDWPSQVVGAILPDKFYTNPHLRKYLSDATSLVTLLANSRKGQPTNFKLKFEQLSKPDFSMPIETQEALLVDIIKNAEEVFETQKLIDKYTEENEGKTPRNIRRLLSSNVISQIDSDSSQSSAASPVVSPARKGNIRQKSDGSGALEAFDPNENRWRPWAPTKK